MIGRRVFVGGGLALGACATLPSANPPRTGIAPLWGTLSAGPYEAGFSIDWLNNGERRVQRWRWFPGLRLSGEPMTVRDYGTGYVAGGGAGWPSDPRAVYATGYDESGDVERFSKLLDLAVAARANARPVRGRFPLVIIGQGFAFESPFHQHVLGEYLASWGYRVATAPLTGAIGPKTDVSPATLSAQMADLALLAERDADRRGLALVGYDLGGMASVALAGTGRLRPDLLVGVDSGVMSAKLTADLITNRPDFSWDRLTMPYLHFTRTAAENQARNLPEDLRIFDQAAAPRYLIRVPGMRHADFGTIGAIENVYPGLYGRVPGRPALGHAQMLWLIRDALDHFLLRKKTGGWRPSVVPPVMMQSWNGGQEA